VLTLTGPGMKSVTDVLGQTVEPITTRPHGTFWAVGGNGSLHLPTADGTVTAW